MAGNWHNSIKSRDHSRLEEPMTQTKISSEVVQVSGKTWFKKLRAKISSLNPKGALMMSLKVIAIALPIVAVMFLVKEIQRKQSLNSNAGTSTAKLFFQTNEFSLPPDSDLQLLLNTDGPVGFVRAEINFDKSLSNLVNEIDVSQSPLRRIVKVTSMAEANSTGKIEIVLGLEPSNLSTPPNGNLQIAKLRFGSVTQTVNAVTNITINSSSSQVVNTNMTIFTLTTVSTSLTLNPSTPVPTVVASPTTSPSTSPTIEPAATATPVTSKSCNSCHKRRCDGKCDPKREDSSCPDCI